GGGPVRAPGSGAGVRRYRHYHVAGLVSWRARWGGSGTLGGLRVMGVVADARDLPIGTATVDLVVTSPPYFGLRDYANGHNEIGRERLPSEYVNQLVLATREMVRVLRPRGSIFVNLGDCYTAYNANRGDGRLQ